DGHRGGTAGRSGAGTCCKNISGGLISEEIELSRLAEDDVNLPAQLKSGERGIKVMPATLV
ncbi:hypothetical protein MWG58_31630, partial [Streptomyces sp. WAC00276]|uniref:hypothetical protein n=1 Tax=Streptomyces sp. WAC00276 TaxID=2933778 RepID=UPI001FFE2D9A